MALEFKISVVVPSYNREKTIIRCIDSVMKQTYPAFEIIVVDDGSTDRTLDVIEKEYGNKVKVARQEHKGAQAARNAGIRTAKGNYIAFHDSDDEWLPDKLELQVAELEKNPDAVVCGNGMIQKDFGGKMSKAYDGLDKKNSKPGKRWAYCLEGKSGYVYKQILSNSFCLFPALLTSKKNLLAIGMLDEDVPSFQEWDTAIRLAKEHEFAFIKKPLFIYHLHDGETISKGTKRNIDGWEYLYDKHQLDMIQQLGTENMAQKYKALFKKCKEYKDKRLLKYIIRYVLAKKHLFFLHR